MQHILDIWKRTHNQYRHTDVNIEEEGETAESGVTEDTQC
jgi:hypothetical protein